MMKEKIDQLIKGIGQIQSLAETIAKESQNSKIMYNYTMFYMGLSYLKSNLTYVREWKKHTFIQSEAIEHFLIEVDNLNDKLVLKKMIEERYKTPKMILMFNENILDFLEGDNLLRLEKIDNVYKSFK